MENAGCQIASKVGMENVKFVKMALIITMDNVLLILPLNKSLILETVDNLINLYSK
jgi:hypothetical protein